MLNSSTPISELTVGQLNELLRQGPDTYMATPEAAAYIRKSPGALRQIVFKKQIRCSKRGTSLYFLKKDLDSWMMAGIRPVSEENAEDILKTKGGSHK